MRMAGVSLQLQSKCANVLVLVHCACTNANVHVQMCKYKFANANVQVQMCMFKRACASGDLNDRKKMVNGEQSL